MFRRVLHVGGAGAMALILATGLAAATAGFDVRVSTHDLITNDVFASSVGGPADVLQQNEPHIAIHPTNTSLLAVGMNDVRTLGVSDDAWQGLAVSNDGGASYTVIPGDKQTVFVHERYRARLTAFRDIPVTRLRRGSPRRSAAMRRLRIRGWGSTGSTTSFSRSSRFSARRRVSRRTRRRTRLPWPSTRSILRRVR